MADSVAKSKDTTTKSTNEKRKFKNSNKYHEYECETVQSRAENGFEGLIEVSERRININELELCGHCKKLKENNCDEVRFSRNSDETSMSRVTIRIPESRLRAIETKAENESFSNRCEVIREAIREYMD